MSVELEHSHRRTGTECKEGRNKVSGRQDQRVPGEQEISVGSKCSEYQKDKIGM